MPKLTALSLLILTSASSSSRAATYTIVVKGLGENVYVQDARFQVRTKTGLSVLQNEPQFDPRTKSYSLEISEPKLDEAQTMQVELIVDAPGRIRTSYDFLLGKHNHKIGILLPKRAGVDAKDCGAPIQSVQIPVPARLPDCTDGGYWYWDGCSWRRFIGIR
jgi:hypothetical protein